MIERRIAAVQGRSHSQFPHRDIGRDFSKNCCSDQSNAKPSGNLDAAHQSFFQHYSILRSPVLPNVLNDQLHSVAQQKVLRRQRRLPTWLGRSKPGYKGMQDWSARSAVSARSAPSAPVLTHVSRIRWLQMLFTLLRSALWLRLDLRAFLQSYGTAGGNIRFLGTPQQAYLPGIPW